MRMIEAMNLTVLTPDSAPAASQPILEAITDDLGFVPHLVAVTAASPTLLGAFDTLRRTVADPTFTPVHREIAGVAAGVAVDNAYGVAFHSTVLDTLGVDEVDIDSDASRVRTQRPGARRHLPRFARDVVMHRGKVDDGVIQRAHDAGLTDADLLQLVAECVFAGLVGTIDNLAGRVSLDDFLEPRGSGNRNEMIPRRRAETWSSGPAGRRRGCFDGDVGRTTLRRRHRSRRDHDRRRVHGLRRGWRPDAGGCDRRPASPPPRGHTVLVTVLDRRLEQSVLRGGCR